MEDKLDKIIELLEDTNIKIDLLEVDIEEIKNGVSKETIEARIAIQEHSVKVSELRLKLLNLQAK